VRRVVAPCTPGVPEEVMMRTWIPFLIGLAVSLGVYRWLDNLLYPRDERRASSDGGGGDFGIADWFGSSDHSGGSDGDGDGGGDGGGGD
jgi:hypothetical protein